MGRAAEWEHTSVPIGRDRVTTIPLVGAVLAGCLAVVVALLAKGVVHALLTLGLLVVIAQLEAHLLQPLVMGRAVSIHPLGVVLAISTGGVLAGIVGALLAVPTTAFLNNALQVLLAKDPVAKPTSRSRTPTMAGPSLRPNRTNRTNRTNPSSGESRPSRRSKS